MRELRWRLPRSPEVTADKNNQNSSVTLQGQFCSLYLLVGSHAPTYAAVDAKTSDLFAFVISPVLAAKRKVKSPRRPSFNGSEVTW